MTFVLFGTGLALIQRQTHKEGFKNGTEGNGEKKKHHLH